MLNKDVIARNGFALLVLLNIGILVVFVIAFGFTIEVCSRLFNLSAINLLVVVILLIGLFNGIWHSLAYIILKKQNERINDLTRLLCDSFKNRMEIACQLIDCVTSSGHDNNIVFKKEFIESKNEFMNEEFENNISSTMLEIIDGLKAKQQAEPYKKFIDSLRVIEEDISTVLGIYNEAVKNYNQSMRISSRGGVMLFFGFEFRQQLKIDKIFR